MVRLGVDIQEAVMPTRKSRAKRRDNRQRGAGRILPNDKEFIAWDGEGMTLDGVHRYVLFGNSTGSRLKIDDAMPIGLDVRDLLHFIVDEGMAHPDAWHVGFAFNYDVNMIIRGLPQATLSKLHKSKNGFVRWQEFGITYRASKWFQVTRYHSNYDRDTNPHAADTTRIYDIFGFFVCSFVKAVKDLLGEDSPGLQLVMEGKGRRKDFRLDELSYVERYWEIEIDLLKDLVDELRTRLYGAGLEITQWHGPGALANYKLGQQGIKQHMKENDSGIREAARYAYAGGRFELFKVGRVEGPIYSIDINSAYPSYIAQLPSMSAGYWRHNPNPSVKHLKRFAMYRVQLYMSVGFDLPPAPFFHRDEKHNISYPWINDNWVWAPEIYHFRTLPGANFKILEGWEYVEYDQHDFPFDWVRDVYETRRRWKKEGNANQYALKLLMNSLYGKMAQRIGWDEENDRKPPWHQLEWAGWVTASTRAQLYSIMRQIPQEHLVAVETDGIYTTLDPAKLGIKNSKELGEWEIDEYDELYYIQSGLAFLRHGTEWTSKYRGLDSDSITVEKATEYLKDLRANDRWSPYVGQTTRFIGLGAALNRSMPLKVAHCRWETTPREIYPGEKGKRIHVRQRCQACANGLNAYEAPHDLVIRSRSAAGKMSAQHFIPWEGNDDAENVEWLQESAEHAGLIKDDL